jgi:hypothetical protein
MCVLIFGSCICRCTMLSESAQRHLRNAPGGQLDLAGLLHDDSIDSTSAQPLSADGVAADREQREGSSQPTGGQIAARICVKHLATQGKTPDLSVVIKGAFQVAAEARLPQHVVLPPSESTRRQIFHVAGCAVGHSCSNSSRAGLMWHRSV